LTCRSRKRRVVRQKIPLKPSPDLTFQSFPAALNVLDARQRRRQVTTRIEGETMKLAARTLLATGAGIALSVSVAIPAPAGTVLNVGPGTLQAKGVVATVPVTFTCALNTDYSLSLWVRQSVQKTVTEGQYGIGGQCTGNAQTVTLEIRPYPKPYKTGVASAQVFLDAWCYDDSGMWYCPDTKTQEIRLK
jgi:hypothetical protein